jgi:hypothetical protein
MNTSTNDYIPVSYLNAYVCGDENHQKTGFKLIPFLFPITQAEQK